MNPIMPPPSQQETECSPEAAELKSPLAIETEQVPSHERLWATVASILFLAALGISLYLAWQSAAGKAVPGCGPQSGCSLILASRWSVAGGVPVSLIGAGVYAALFAFAVSGRPKSTWRRKLELGTGVLVLGGALWFTIVQAFLLKAFCPWCSTVHLLACTGVVVLWRARRRKTPSTANTGSPGLVEFALPLLAVAGMAWFQGAATEPERIQERTMTPSAVSASGKISLHQGRIEVDPAMLPIIGLPQAEVTAVALTDFTCPHCRELHRTLAQLAAQRPGQFNAVLLPAAYEPEARELHRIMLALWRIDPERYRKLAEEIVDGTLNPTANEVLVAIQKPLGDRFYELAWPHAGWIEGTLKLGEELLALNGREAGASTLPQTLIRDRILTGAPHLETLAGIIEAAPEAVSPSLAVAEAPTPAAPEVTTAAITFDSTTVDLGTVTRGEPLTRKVTFTNTGSAPLTLAKIKASCGCTTVKGWEQTVAPGQQGSFELKLDTAKFIGLVSKTVDVESNASNGTVRLTIKAKVWSPVTLHPPAVTFGPTIKGSKIEPRLVEVAVTESEPLNIAGLTCSNPYFKTELTTLEEGRRYQLLVSVPELGERPQTGELILKLGHPKLDELKLPVHISPVDPLVVQPKQINISAASLKTSPASSITIFCHDPAVASLEVTDLAYSGGSDVAVSFERQGNNRWGRILLKFPAGFAPGEAKETSVSFRTNHPAYPQITVPVRFFGPASIAKQSPATTITR